MLLFTVHNPWIHSPCDSLWAVTDPRFSEAFSCTLAGLFHAASAKGSAEASNAISGQHGLNKHHWSAASTVRWSQCCVYILISSIRAAVTFCFCFFRDCICLQTCLTQWVVWAGGICQEQPVWLQPVASTFLETSSWISRASTHLYCTGLFSFPLMSTEMTALAITTSPWSQTRALITMDIIM